MSVSSTCSPQIEHFAPPALSEKITPQRQAKASLSTLLPHAGHSEISSMKDSPQLGHVMEVSGTSLAHFGHIMFPSPTSRAPHAHVCSSSETILPHAEHWNSVDGKSVEKTTPQRLQNWWPS